MEVKRFAIPYHVKFNSFEKLNERFSKCKCYVQALDKNRNRTYFSKKSVLDAFPSLYGVPIVGHIVEDDDGNKYMGGHDSELIIDKNGFYLKSLCVPYGFVPKQESACFETITEPSGEEKTYLVSDIILWTGRFPELLEVAYSDDIWFNQSMEVLASDYGSLKDDPDYTDIREFTYDALCLLGKADDINSAEHTEPCFPGAVVIPCNSSSQADNYSELVCQLFSEMAIYFNPQKKQKEGGDGVTLSTKTRDSILQEFKVDNVGKLDFVITDTMTEAEFRDAVANFVDNHNHEGNTKSIAYGATYGQKRDAIQNALPQDYYADDGSESYCWLMDFDDEYVYVEKTDYDADGGRNQSVGRFKYEFTDGEAPVAQLIGEFEPMVIRWLTLEEADKLEQSRNLFEELKQFKSDRLEEDKVRSVDEILAEFVDLFDNFEFSELCENAYKIEDCDELRTKCFAIRGKNVKVTTLNQFHTRQVLDNSAYENTDTRYGTLFSRYSKKKLY
ncbi:MAG: hypothetical protein RR365_01040 [Bacteroides sp.]